MTDSGIILANTGSLMGVLGLIPREYWGSSNPHLKVASRAPEQWGKSDSGRKDGLVIGAED